jgi:hypothetical protein
MKKLAENRTIFLLMFVFMVPYLGQYGLYRLISISIVAVLILITLLELKKNDQITLIINTSIIALVFLIFILGAMLERGSMGDSREVVRILAIIIGLNLFYNNTNIRINFYFFIFIFMVSLFANYDRNYGPDIIKMYAASTEFDWGYSRWRNVMFGGQPAISGYLFAILTLMTMSSVRTDFCKLVVAILGITLVLTTVSRGPFAFLALGILQIYWRKLWILAPTSICFIIIMTEQSQLDALLERWLKFDTLFHRFGNFGYVVELYSDRETIFNLFFGCAFSRNCMFTGDWRSVSLDGSYFYIFSNWGLIPLFVLFFLFIYLFLRFVRCRDYKTIFILFVIMVCAAMDPLLLDIKLIVFNLALLFQYHNTKANLARC